MKVQEFSDTFTTLLNSYNTQAQFGEQASSREIVLDEYEKSVLLTQAQDIIVKSYFDHSLNQQGQGFDDSTRRQVDFSSLIKVAKLSPVLGTSYTFDWVDGNGYIGTVKVQNRTSHKLHVVAKIDWTATVPRDGVDAKITGEGDDMTITLTINGSTEEGVEQNDLNTYASEAYADMGGVLQVINRTYIYPLDNNEQVMDYVRFTLVKDNEEHEIPDFDDRYTMVDKVLQGEELSNFDDRSLIFDMPTNSSGNTEVLFVLNEKVDIKGKSYVVVPINYREYDREMSKPFAQPLKKQAWRLFQNLSTGFDVHSELILKQSIFDTFTKDDEIAKNLVYKIRYVKRPQPIILEDLPNDLVIDGQSKQSECELNPILHMDILNKAVELAIATRGQRPAANQNSNQ